MEKTLKVIKPFFVMEEGDTFERTENNTYKSEYSSEYQLEHADYNKDNDFHSSYNSSFEISEDYAKALIELGHLEEVKESKDFVNVFDEIDKLCSMYIDDLGKLDDDFAKLPACLKIEKETVLRNALEILDHLRSLKK